MFTLNLLFNLNDTNGRVTGDRGGVPLRKSMNWLKLRDPEPANPNPPAFDPETANWTDLGQASTILLPFSANPGNICVRIAPDPVGPPPPIPLDPRATLQLVVSFGAPARARQKQASPFQTPDGSIMTTFAFGPSPRNTSAGWFFPLGSIALAPAHVNLTDRYEFTVGFIVNSGGLVRHYGEDPDMDVGL